MRAFLDISHVQSLRVGVKWEKGNSGAEARGAHEEGKNPWELVKIACFTAVHSSVADYFAFRIKWDALYALS